jgi:hypothetical protein
MNSLLNPDDKVFKLHGCSVNLKISPVLIQIMNEGAIGRTQLQRDGGVASIVLHHRPLEERQLGPLGFVTRASVLPNFSLFQHLLAERAVFRFTMALQVYVFLIFVLALLRLVEIELQPP